jgi:hypothetical protein
VSRWYRAYAGTVTDAKLAEAALIANVSRSVSIAAWHCLLESAAERNNCGSYETSARRVAVILCEPPATIEALLQAFDELGLIGDGAVTAWKKRQFQSDADPTAAERQRRKRERDKQSGNGHVTRDSQPPETEANTETEEGSPSGDSSSGDERPLAIEEVFQGYQKLASDLGLSVPRDLTPERRQIIRFRTKQYPLDDFRTVFAKCRDSPFLRGDKGRTPLTFDWIFKKGNFQKTLEGNYD